MLRNSLVTTCKQWNGDSRSATFLDLNPLPNITDKWAFTGVTGAGWPLVNSSAAAALFVWRVCLMTGYYSGHLPLFYKNAWHKNESTDSKWLPHCPNVIQKKKKMWTPEKPRAADFQPQTDRHWVDSKLGRNWAKVKKGAKNAVNYCLKDEAPTDFKAVGHLGTEPSFSLVTFSLYTVFKNPLAENQRPDCKQRNSFLRSLPRGIWGVPGTRFSLLLLHCSGKKRKDGIYVLSKG